jgi:hypothetical protein
MTTQWVRRCLGMLGLAMALIAVGAIVVGWTSPLAESEPIGKGSVPHATEPVLDKKSAVVVLQREDFIPFWSRRLRSSLEELPVIEPVQSKSLSDPVAEVPPPIFSGKLVATLLAKRPDESVSWINFGDGLPRRVRTDEVLEDIAGRPRIIQIRDKEVTVELEGERLIISLPDRESPLFKEP